MYSPAAILDYWVGPASLDPHEAEARQAFWYGASRQRDKEIAARFGALLDQAREGRLDDWAKSASGRLSLVILLDQFSRNIYRGTAAAFSQDARALALARTGVDSGAGDGLSEVERSFLYLPFQHAEDADCQRESVSLYKRLREESRPEFRAYASHCLQYAVDHCDIIVRFGRFPHRNAILGRSSTEKERAYLTSGAPSYGQTAAG